MALEGEIDDQMKYKINKVMEIVKNRSEDDVMLVLQYFDNDIDTTIDAFLEDGAADILKKWNHKNSIKPTNKNKKKKKNKKKSSIADSSSAAASESVSNGDSVSVPSAEMVTSESTQLANGSSSHVEESNRDSSASVVEDDVASRVSPSHSQTVITPDSQSLQRLKGEESSVLPSVNRLSAPCPVEPDSTTTTTSATATTGTIKGASLSGSGTERSSVSPSDHSRSINRNRHRSSGSQSRASQESSRAEAPPFQAPTAAPSAPSSFSQGPGKKILEKSLKDLSRQTVALQRVSNLLEEELDNSFKRIKTAIAEAHRLLEDRSQDLERDMERVKKESRLLLSQRKDLAAELKHRAERSSTMSEAELNELRADIKHFVVERKYDEELGKTCRFMWDKDRITEEIKSFGEVYHVKNCYSQRRQSVSSVASSSNMTSSVTEAPELSHMSQTELDQETPEPRTEPTVPDTRPQGPSRARFFFRRNVVNSDSNRQGYNRGNYPSRGRGGSENRGRGGGRGGRREDNYRGSHDAPYHSKPHYMSQKVEEHSSSSGAGTGSIESGGGSAGGMGGVSSAGGWPPRDQRAPRRGGGRHNARFQGRMQAHHSPRRNFGSNERVPSTSDTRVNGNETSDLLNGFVDH